MVDFCLPSWMKRSIILVIIMAIGIVCQEIVFAFSDDFSGYYMIETNECPQAVDLLKKTGKWSGLTITPIEITFPDGKSCALSDESHRAGFLSMTLLCSSDQKRSGVYEFDLKDTQLVMIRNRERQPYVRCRSLNSSGTNNSLQNGRQSTGIDVGSGAKVHPYVNNNSLRMKMNLPFN